MYRKDSTGWIKHVDFIILDLICLQVAFVLAYALSGYGANPYQLILYRNMAVFMEVADLVVLFAMGTLKNVLKRGYYKDFVVTAQHGIILGACLLLYLFMLQEGQQYSRLALVLNIVIYILLTYLVRELWKHLLRKKMEDGENRSLLLVVSADVVSSVVESMKEHNYARYKIAGIAVIDKEMTGKYIDGVKVVANMENAAEYVCKEWIDEVLIVTSGVVPYPKELIEQFTETGVTVHLNLAKVQSVPGKKQFVEKVGDYTVLTTSINYASTRDDKVDNPVSLYAATKKSNELMAHAYSKLYNIPSTGLRFFTVYGPAGRPDMAYFGFTNKLLNGATIKIFNYGNCKRDFTYVDDIVEGVVRVMQGAPEKKNGEDGLPIPPYAVYNIGNNHPENLLDFVEILQEELIRAKVLPEDYDFEAHKELVPMQPGDVPVTYADTEALERDYGFKPSTTLREGLRKFAEWYKEFYM